KAALGQVADRLEILLDRFVAAAKQHDGTLERRRRRAEQPVAQLDPVGGNHEAAAGLFRNGVASNFMKEFVHAAKTCGREWPFAWVIDEFGTGSKNGLDMPQTGRNGRGRARGEKCWLAERNRAEAGTD